MNRTNKIVLTILGVGFAAIVVMYIFRDKIIKPIEDMAEEKQFDTSSKWYADQKTRKIVERLHPQFRYLVGDFFTRMEKDLGLSALATSGYRSIDEQKKLYAQNKQNAKPGYSSHNYGFAIDMNIKDKNGKIILGKSSSSDAWRKSGVVKLSEELGMKWGGGGAFGTYHDPVHFYISPGGKKTTDLLALHNKGNVDQHGYVLV